VIIRFSAQHEDQGSQLSVLELSIRNIRSKINPKKSRMQKRESRAKENTITAAFLALSETHSDPGSVRD